MIKLNLKKEPYWIDLPSSVRLFVRPLTTAIMSAAQNAILKDIAALKENDPALSTKSDEELVGLHNTLLIKALARYAILKWEGVLEQDSDNVAPVNDKNVSDLMDIWFMAQGFLRQYTNSLSMLETEGNLSGPAPNGTSVAEPVTARAAKRKNFRAAKVKRAR